MVKNYMNYNLEPREYVVRVTRCHARGCHRPIASVPTRRWTGTPGRPTRRTSCLCADGRRYRHLLCCPYTGDCSSRLGSFLGCEDPDRILVPLSWLSLSPAGLLEVRGARSLVNAWWALSSRSMDELQQTPFGRWFTATAWLCWLNND
jgi:hypothetical protein